VVLCWRWRSPQRFLGVYVSVRFGELHESVAASVVCCGLDICVNREIYGIVHSLVDGQKTET
jgi:hypothetical protein